ncbi:hypothetical protein SPBR_01349 [Sporothrix brasiliensis 5110]|uniref:Involucrin repeat protein n=1 Tax=Sporothrix brasiliensis 5110 TaxID=1398154 RepID=A0A0C2IR36_9PEZI|nr:uncharacterized protein SPBR_01349 [Sporothrix brasiliensis 5110]KIH91476.1 hypothetical protein SPBR_01349 [Sporothrix brasiliensis 5110]
MLNSHPAAATSASSLTSASSISSSSSSSVVSSTSDVNNSGGTAGYRPLSSISSFSGTPNPPVTVASSTTPQQPGGGGGGGAASASTSVPVGSSSSANRSSSKRRGAGPTAAGVASSSHVLRTTSAVTAAAASTSGAGSGGGTGGSSSHNNDSNQRAGGSGPPSPPNNSGSAAASSGILIAPPPRVALGAGNQSTSTVPDPPSGTSSGDGGNRSTSGPGGGGSGNSGNSGSGGGSGSGSAGGGGGSGGGVGMASSASSSSNSTKDAHFVYTANHHSYHQRQHHHHHHGHHSISSLASSSSSVSAAATAASLNAAAASAQLVKEKDMRITQLERELHIMEAEFTRELDKLSKAESEAATFWQAKNNRLQQQLAQTDTENQLLRAEVELREAERAELRAGWEEMQRSAVARDEEARSLREQVRGLKEWVSTSTRAGGQVASDEVFGDGMARLANGVQNWVIMHFRRAKLDTDKASKNARESLAQLVPMYDDLRHSAKLHLLQSAVSRVLVDLIFDAYFVGLPPQQAAQLEEVESFLKPFAGTAEPINQWRALTLDIVSKDSAQQLQAETTRVVDQVVTRVNDVLDAITDVQRTDARDHTLRQLVTSALELARLLVIQKAVFRVIMPSIVPHQQVLFDAATMEDIGGEEDDDDGLSLREIACVTFPGIIKRGDETGSHLQYTNVICKARVLCAAE